MKLKLVNGGAQGSEIELSDATFGREFNEPLVHQVLTAFAAAGRAGTKAQLTTAEVRGGGTAGGEGLHWQVVVHGVLAVELHWAAAWGAAALRESAGFQPPR